MFYLHYDIVEWEGRFYKDVRFIACHWEHSSTKAEGAFIFKSMCFTQIKIDVCVRRFGVCRGKSDKNVLFVPSVFFG